MLIANSAEKLIKFGESVMDKHDRLFWESAAVMNVLARQLGDLSTFFKDKKIRKTEQEVYPRLDDVSVRNLTSKDEVKDRISKYLQSDVNITSVEYGWVLLPSHRAPGWADTTWPVGEEEVNNVWKIDVEKDDKKISLTVLHGDIERKLMTAEQFNKLRTEAEQRRVAMATGKQKQ